LEELGKNVIILNRILRRSVHKKIFFCDIKTAGFSERPAASAMRVDEWRTEKTMGVQEEGGIGQISGRATERWDEMKARV
jgi:hypothetical protein